ncbi:MAG: FAD-binding dehydrogenase [Leptospiraceae bacterium]|nr:FAD-binding dehydrogenase [Leptospiraceae bacterium]MCP5511021.1 FAD-binding dehydrogenase [Leptospiraceae bacterium]
MTTTKKYQADIIIIGGGVAGMITALELLEAGKKVLLLDRDEEKRFGGLARESFGGIFVVNSPLQKKMGIRDSTDLALRDWKTAANFGEGPDWVYPRQWAETYIHRSLEDIYLWLTQKLSIKFFPVVHWAERGLFEPANSVPRFHMLWGLGYSLTEVLKSRLNQFKGKSLEVYFRHNVKSLIESEGQVTTCTGVDELDGSEFKAIAGEALVIATGGINGDLDRVRKLWDRDEFGTPPETILNGSHRYANGSMHDQVSLLKGKLSHMKNMWNYPSGVRHPNPDKDLHGVTIVPPKSALWMNWQGRRMGPPPLVGNFDTRYIVEEICRQEKKYSWQILNFKIAKKELAVQNADFNPAIRDKKLFGFLKTVLLGNASLVREFIDTCPDFVVANSITELAEKMNQLQGDESINAELMERDIRQYDENIGRGQTFHNDPQLRLITHARNYRGDRLRTCKFQKILDPSAGPLIAIRMSILSRKSLGGIQTDLSSRVMSEKGQPIRGLYSVGESAGFGGGGIHGQGALEGTFIGSCILTARAASRSILNKK